MKKLFILVLICVGFVAKGQVPMSLLAEEVDDTTSENVVDTLGATSNEAISFEDIKELGSKDFWVDILDSIIHWSLRELPVIVVMTLMLIFALRFLRLIVRKLKQISSRSMQNHYEEHEIHENEKRIDTLSGIVISVGKIVMWIIYILLLLGRFNIDVAPLLASAGILGLAIGFGAQELVRDFISGFFILLEDQVRTGDVAIINGVSGKVEKIEMRTITLRDVSGVVHIFQNGKIDSLSNMTKGWSAIVVEIGIAYKENTDDVSELLKKVCEEMLADDKFKGLMLSYDILGLDSFGDSSVNLLIKLTTKSGEQWMLSREFRRRVKLVFDAEGVEIPFPHISLYAGEQTKSIPISIEKE